MSDFQVKTPVGLIIFNRPQTTQKVFDAIRKMKPLKLYVVADGPRTNSPDDMEKCEKTRAIIKQIDWECQVFTKFSNKNLGCGRGPSSGISWIFEQEEEAIILEDDCVPNQSFFRYCQENLKKYREDKRVMLISGTNTLGEWKSSFQSYHFSVYGGIWGWASWRRAWNYFDFEMKLWGDKEIRDRLRDVIGKKHFNQRKDIYTKTYYDHHDVSWWDYQWGFARHIQSGLAIVPSRNLITNIGCGTDATHTSGSVFCNRQVHELEFPLKHSKYVVVDKEYDNKFFDKISNQENLVVRIIRGMCNKIRKIAAFRQNKIAKNF